MIERYTNPEMGNIWTLQHEFEVMLDVEIAACEAMAELGEIPKEAAKNIREKAHFELDRVKEIEKETKKAIQEICSHIADYKRVRKIKISKEELARTSIMKVRRVVYQGVLDEK